VAARRLRVVDDETLVFRLKTPWADGTTSPVLSPTELIEKLAVLVPPPRTHLIRYHGGGRVAGAVSIGFTTAVGVDAPVEVVWRYLT
jgi:uncharacterized protein YndB with AHSA1/START domain